MKVRYRNDLCGNYILIEIPQGEDPNQYPFKMLEKNRIPGVLPCKERMEDGRSYWYADISKKRNLAQEYQDREMQLEDMITIFQQITPILEELKNYLLNETMAVMDPEFIYRDLEDDSLHVLIVPWNTEEKTLHKLAEFFLEKINHRDENGVNAAYLFYRQQNQSHFSLYHFLPVLEKESILKRQKTKEKESNSLENRENGEVFWNGPNEKALEESNLYEFKEEESPIDTKRKTKRMMSIVFLILSIISLIISFLPVINSGLKISCMALSFLLFVVFIILSLCRENIQKAEKKPEYPAEEKDIGMKETVFFDSSENEEYLKLQWKEKGRKKQFVLKDFPCTVGKIQEEVSLCIADVSVSRVHCRFVKKENRVCIMDLNSTNGTYLNGLSIKNGEILEIEKNDEILIGKVRVYVV